MAFEPTPEMRQWWLTSGRHELPLVWEYVKFINAISKDSSETTRLVSGPSMIAFLKDFTMHKAKAKYARWETRQVASATGDCNVAAQWMGRASYNMTMARFIYPYATMKKRSGGADDRLMRTWRIKASHCYDKAYARTLVTARKSLRRTRIVTYFVVDFVRLALKPP